jgi:hypothetical protein
VAQLKDGLAVAVGAEALSTLTDLSRLGPEETIAGVVRSATTLTRAVLESAAPAGARPAAQH